MKVKTPEQQAKMKEMDDKIREANRIKERDLNAKKAIERLKMQEAYRLQRKEIEEKKAIEAARRNGKNKIEKLKKLEIHKTKQTKNITQSMENGR